MRRHPLMSFGLVALVLFFLVSIWVDSGPAEELDQPPVADAGRDTTVECTGTFFTQFKTPVVLDGTGSYDPDGGPINYLWTAPGIDFDDAASPTPTGRFPLGTTTVTLTVSSGGLNDEDTVDVTVEDTTPPLISVSLNRDVLWPPNHMMVDIFAAVAVTQGCCGSSPVVVLDSIWSSEPDDGLGDGSTVDDIQDADTGVRDTVFKIRSERQGGGEGRVYTMIYTATDCAGNVGSDTVSVRVPQSQAGGKALSSLGFATGGTELDPGAAQFVLVVLSEPELIKVHKKKGLIVISEGVDATALDLERTYVGNVKGVLTPQRADVIDINADGLDDLALYYSSRALNLLLDECTGGTIEDQWEALYGPIGLHYTSAAGVDYLVPDIFALGSSVALEAGAAMEGPEQTGPGNTQGTCDFVLNQNYPNPFNPTTTISFTLPSDAHVHLAIYDVEGKLVRTVVSENLAAGPTAYTWDGRDAAGNPVSTGVYFYRLTAGTRTLTKKMTLLK